MVEDSPFLRQLRDESLARGNREGLEQGQMREARAVLRQIALTRIPTLTANDLASIDAISELERLHALVPVLMQVADSEAFRRALREGHA